MIHQGHKYKLIDHGSVKHIIIEDCNGDVVVDEKINILVDCVSINKDIIERFIGFRTFGSSIDFRRFIQWTM